jgi:hypothetical protein
LFSVVVFVFVFSQFGLPIFLRITLLLINFRHEND